MTPETYVDSGGVLNGICYGLCKCFVWPIVYDYRFPHTATNFGKCKRCKEKPQLLDPTLYNKQEAISIFNELYGHYPEPFIV